MKVRKRSLVASTSKRKALPKYAYINVYRVSDQGLRDSDNQFYHTGPSRITFLGVYEFGGVPLDTTLDDLYVKLSLVKWVINFPGMYFTLSTDPKFTTNFVVTKEGSIERGFPYGPAKKP